MPQAVENREMLELPEATRSLLSRLSGGAAPIAIRDGIAVFDQLVEIDGEKRNLEIAMREVQIRSGSAREETIERDGKQVTQRLCDVIWTTGATVRRYDWWNDEHYDESLEVSESAIRMTRMNDGAPLLNSHYSWDTRDVLGRVERVWIEKGVGYATVRFSNRKSVDEIWQDVSEGILSKISVGYRVHAWEIVRKDGQVTTKRATDWEPHEISLVAIPADSGCSVRSWNSLNAPATRMEGNVPQPTNTTPATDGADTETRTDVQTPASETRAGNPDAADIVRYASVEANGLTMADALRFIDEGKSLNDVVRSNLAAHAAAAQETAVNTNRTSASVTGERSPDREMELRREAFSAVQLERAGFKAPEISDEAREFAGQSVRSIAMACLRNAGRTVSSDADDYSIIGEAFEMRSQGGVIASSDIAIALGEPVRAVLETKYEDEIEETNYQNWTGSTTVPNFKPQKAIHVGLLTGIRDISEGGQIPLARLGAGARFFQLGTRGLKISFTREAIINDDFGILLQAVGKLGVIYRHDEQAIAVRALNQGKLVTDQGEENVFDEVYGNYVEVEALDVPGMAAARQALRSQKLGEEYAGMSITVNPRRLLVSPDLELPALQLVSAIAAAKAGDANPYAGTMAVDIINELPEGTAFLTGSKSLSDVIQTARLARAQGPQIEKLPMKTVMSAEWETFNDFTAFAAGRYGIVKIKVTG